MPLTSLVLLQTRDIKCMGQILLRPTADPTNISGGPLAGVWPGATALRTAIKLMYVEPG